MPDRNKTHYSLRYVTKKIIEDRVSYAFVAPFMVLFLIFTVLPVAISIYFSFTYFNVLEAPLFVGFKNYIRLFFRDPIFIIAVKNTLIFAIVTGPVSYMLSFMVAWFINELTPKIRAFITLIFYAPSIAGNVYLIWNILFMGDSYGFVNGWLLRLGIIDTPILFFKDVKYMMPLCVVVVLWLSLGVGFLAFIAGLQGIDRVYYEASSVDGVKNRWQELWYITLPLMKNQLMFGAVMTITSSFSIGGVITGLVGNPSTEYATHTIMHHLEDYGGTRFEMGYASAIAVVLFIIMLASNLIVKRIISKVGE